MGSMAMFYGIDRFIPTRKVPGTFVCFGKSITFVVLFMPFPAERYG